MTARPYFNRPFNGLGQRVEPYNRLGKRLRGGCGIYVGLDSIDDVKHTLRRVLLQCPAGLRKGASDMIQSRR